MYALMAAGLVLTYRAAGVFNLAFGAQAYISAVSLYIAVANGWPIWVGALLSIGVVSPALGFVLDRVIFRHTRNASPFVTLVPAIGLLVVLPSAVDIIFGAGTRINPPSLFLSARTVYFSVAGLAVNGTELSTTIITVAIVAILWGALKFTKLGLAMRAVVESARLAELQGVRSGVIGAMAWILSSLLAGLAGVLLAPLYATLSSLNFTDLLVAAIAAAAFGAFVSLPFTLIGGVLLGIAGEMIAGYLPPGSVWSAGLPSALPFIVLLVMLVVRPTFRVRREVVDPMQSCEAPPRSLEIPRRARVVFVGSRALGAALAVAFAVSLLTWIPHNWAFTLGQGIVYSIIFLSIVLLTGMSNEISLAQATFAGIGAFTAGQLANHFGFSVLVGALAGTAVAAAVGAVIAIPTARLSGIALALATLGFALVMSDIVFPFSWAGNGGSGITVPRPQIGPISFQSTRTFLVLASVALLVVAVIVALLRSGTVGRELGAIRGSEVGAESIGINTRGMRIMTTALAGGIAGLGGALYGSLEQSVSANDFGYEVSLVFVVVVAIVGVRTISGAIEAGLSFAVLSQVISTLPSRFSSLLAFILGLAALTYVRHPEGVVDFTKRWIAGWAEKLTDRSRGSPGLSGISPGGSVHGGSVAGDRGDLSGDSAGDLSGDRFGPGEGSWTLFGGIAGPKEGGD